MIMPTYNEENHIASSLNKVQSALDALGFDYQVIVVDDGSRGGTRREAIRAARNPRVKVVGYEHNVGKGYALKHGFACTVGDIVVFLGSDISPRQIGAYVAATEHGDIVIASKWHPKSHTEMPIIRKFLSLGFHVVVTILTGLRVSDTQSDMKAFRREGLEKVLPRLATKRFAFDVELLTIASLKGFGIIEYLVDIKISGHTKLEPLVKMLSSMFLEILWITYRLRFLKQYNNKEAPGFNGVCTEWNH